MSNLSNEKLIKEFEDVYTIRLFPQFHDEDSNGLLETYGEEEQFVKDFIDQHPGNIKYVWTVVTGDNDDNLYVVSGYHIVNRINYIISNEPYNKLEEYIWCDFSDEEYIQE